MRHITGFLVLWGGLFWYTTLVFGQGSAVPRWNADASIREELQAIDRLRKHPPHSIKPPRRIPDTVPRPIHIMLLFVDHWEPCDYIYGTGSSGGPIYESEALRLSNFWLNDYRVMASKHHDADGKMPQHTWFMYEQVLKAMQRIALCSFLKLGEIELHFHHGSDDDTHRNNRNDFLSEIKTYLDGLHSIGACVTAEPRPRAYFGFIHGMWALDNSHFVSDVRKYCGVNTELGDLLSLGCYADFTFPSGVPTQPAWRNCIFVSMDSDAPKSYDQSYLIRHLASPGDGIAPSELMIFGGPGGSMIEANIDRYQRPLLSNMDGLVDYNIHIPGRDDWIFVKVMTHSAQNLASSTEGWSNLMGPVADQYYTDIERAYNDGVNYKLHYVTSREAYNIVRAAVDGKSGDPNQYRNYAIQPPVNSRFYCDSRYTLTRFDPKMPSAEISFLKIPAKVEIRAHDFNVDAKVYESDSPDGSFVPSNAQRSSSPTASLILKDATPSRYYQFYNHSHNACKRWGHYH